MKTEQANKGRQLFETHFLLIENLIRKVSNRHRLRTDDHEEFYSYVMWKLLDQDYAILRKFRGSSSLTTYLTTVILRLYLDYRNWMWGKWRSSARAKQLGATAIRLDELLHRDGCSLHEAIEILKINYQAEEAREELFEIASQLPQRQRIQLAGEESLDKVIEHREADERLLARDWSATRERAETVLETSLNSLSAEDRLILKLRFESGFTARKIGALLTLKPRSVYSRLEKILRRLRAAIQRENLTSMELADRSDWRDLPIRVDFEMLESTDRAIHPS